MIKIEFLDGKETLEVEADTLKEAVEKAIREGKDLRRADLKVADLSRSNIDFSCWPLRCGSLGVKIDKRIFCQLLYHTLRAGKSVDDPKVKRLFEIPDVVDLANQFHRVDECGKIELKGENNEKSETSYRAGCRQG